MDAATLYVIVQLANGEVRTAGTYSLGALSAARGQKRCILSRPDQ